jgi:hexosaminidase
MKELQIIPQPRKMEQREGFFAPASQTAIITCKEFLPLADLLAQLLSRDTGFDFEVRQSAKMNRPAGSISLLIATDRSGLGDEGYTLSVKADQIAIRAFRPAGAFYAFQTLRQLLSVTLERGGEARRTAWTVPQVEIEDSPRFPWRGFMLDSSRHFQSKEFILRLIDTLAFYKINRLHWHPCDGIAWRMEIEKYPELTKGADDGEKYEYYTKKDIREIIEYAKTLHIEVYPEVEMPGHSRWALNVFKDLRCENAKEPVNEYCLGSEKTERFFKDVLTEVMDMFPDAVIHLGGDEANVTHWQACPRCQSCIKANGLGNERMLQKWFMQKMTSFVQDNGRDTIAWGEHQELGWPAGQIVQGWIKGGSEYAIAHGIKTVNSEHEHVYFDYPVSLDDPLKRSWMPELPLAKVYSFDPVPAGTTPEQAALVMGSEACLWTEIIPEEKVYERTFPRLLAFSETVWSPKESKDWNSFEKRAAAHLVAFGLIFT